MGYAECGDRRGDVWCSPRLYSYLPVLCPVLAYARLVASAYALSGTGLGYASSSLCTVQY
eukprot:2618131-Rhodomonas_salina.2